MKPQTFLNLDHFFVACILESSLNLKLVISQIRKLCTFSKIGSTTASAERFFSQLTAFFRYSFNHGYLSHIKMEIRFPTLKAYLEPSQTSTMELLLVAKLNNKFRKKDPWLMFDRFLLTTPSLFYPVGKYFFIAINTPGQ